MSIVLKRSHPIPKSQNFGLSLATERSSRLSDDRLLYRLKRRWRNGTTHVIYEPLELMERLAALVPPPRFNMTRYYGVLAPTSTIRPQVIPKAEASSPSRHLGCKSAGVEAPDRDPESDRDSVAEARGDYPRQCGDALDDFVAQGPLFRRIPIFPSRRRHAHRKDMIRTKSRVDSVHARKGLNQQPRSNRQNERQRHLADNQRALHS